MISEDDSNPPAGQCHGQKPLPEGKGALNRNIERQELHAGEWIPPQDISLELGLLKDKTEFFEEVFGIRLVIRRKGRDIRRRLIMEFEEFEKPEYFVNRELSWLKFDEPRTQ